MATRQNKKQRKGRNNANNRERTVTTLTEDPNTPYLVPTPSEEPAGTHMPASFPGPNPGKLHNIAMGTQAYQLSANFGFAYPTFPTPMNMHHQQQQGQQPFFPPQQQPVHPQQSEQQQSVQSPNQQLKSALPPGKNDLEILQNLKKLIIENQHPFFRAVPQPAALASLYKGPISLQSQPQRHAEQATTDYRDDSGESHSGVNPTSASSLDNGRRPPRSMQGKDRRPNPAPTNGGGNQSNAHAQGNRANNNGGNSLLSNLNLASLKIPKSPLVPPPAGPPQSDSRSTDPALSMDYGNTNEVLRRAPESRSRAPPVKTEPSATGDRLDNANVPVCDNRGSGPTDDPMDGTTWRNGRDDSPRPLTWGDVPDDWGSNHVRYAGRDYGTRPENEGIPSSASVDARPSGVANHGAGPPGSYDRESRWGAQSERDRYPVQDRARDTRQADAPQRRSSTSSDQQRPYEADQHPPVRRPPEELSGPQPARRPSDAAHPPSDVSSREQPGHVTEPVPPSPNRPPMSEARVDVRAPPRQTPTDNEDVKSSRASSVRPIDNSAASLGPAPPTSASSENATPVDSHPPSIAGPNPPSLKDRMHPPPRQPQIPSGSPVIAHPEHPPGPPNHPPRNKKRFNKDGAGAGAPPRSGGDRPGYRRPVTPFNGPGPAGRPFRPRSPSLDGRGKGPPSPPGARGRDYRGGGGGPPPRDMSRDRPGGGPYRPDYDDARYGDGRPPFRDYSPPPPPDRASRPYSPPPPPPSGGRGPPGGPEPPKDWGYGYPPRREWSATEEDPYYKRYWENGPPPGDRPPYDRDYPPRSASWDARDRDFGRDVYPPGPPDDRYPMRDADRGRPPPPSAGYNNAPYNRVRPRSPSPQRRASGPPPIDDGRPPMKRPRDDYMEYYPPAGGGRDGPRRGPPPDYPAPPLRTGSPGPPPSSSASTWAPPSSAGGGPTGGPPPGDRNYRMSYDAGPYDRPKSPGPAGGRGFPYSRGGYGRGDSRDRGYGMPPPRP